MVSRPLHTRIFLMAMALIGAPLLAQDGTSPEISPDSRVRAEFFLGGVRAKPLNDPALLQLFGAQKKEASFAVTLTGLKGPVVWLNHPRLAAPIPLDVTRPELWEERRKNDLNLIGDPVWFQSGNAARQPQGQRDPWRDLEDFGLSFLFLDPLPTASGFQTIAKEALPPSEDSYRVRAANEYDGLLRQVLDANFRSFSYAVGDERFTFVTTADWATILLITAQKPLGSLTQSARQALSEKIRKDNGIGANGGWSRYHGGLFGQGTSQGGIWLPEGDDEEGGNRHGEGTIRKCWVSPEVQVAVKKIHAEIQTQWFARRRRELGVATDEQVVASHIQHTRELLRRNPNEAEKDLPVLYAIAQGSHLKEVEEIEEAIPAARSQAEAKAAEEAAWQAKKALREDLCAGYRLLAQYQRDLDYQKKVELESGVKNLSARYDLGNKIVAMKEHLAGKRKAFRQVFGREFDLAKDTQLALQDQGVAAQKEADANKAFLGAWSNRPPTPAPSSPTGRTPGISGHTNPGVYELDESRVKVKVQPPAPPYPPMARIARVQGDVVLQILMDEEGVPLTVHAVEGPPALRNGAEAYALQWRFEPAIADGKPVVARFRFTSTFRLK